MVDLCSLSMRAKYLITIKVGYVGEVLQIYSFIRSTKGMKAGL
jgi:hypothetical protein